MTIMAKRTVTPKKKTTTNVKKTLAPVRPRTMSIGLLALMSVMIIGAIVWLLGTYTRDYLNHDAQVRERNAALERTRY